MLTSEPGTSAFNRRVVVTGMGCVTPLGLSVDETWRNALAGRSGVGRITLFDPTGCPAQIAAEVKGFDVSRPIGPLHPAPDREITQVATRKDARKLGRFGHLGLAAGLEAYADSGLDCLREELAPERIGVNMGVGMGGLPEIEEIHKQFLTHGYKRLTPFFILQTIPNMISGQLSIMLNLRGPNLCNVTACTTSAHSIGESFRLIQRGEADIMIAGGAEAVLCPLGVGGFAAMRALSLRNDDPTKASRPFDRDRDGFVIGEGAAALVLEEYELARRRGARIYGEVVGYGISGDAFHIAAPAPESEGGSRRAMALSLEDAGLNTDQVDYINAHATSTPAGDIEESRAIAGLFEGSKDRLHVSATKSMTGHLLGAAGAIEALFSLLAIYHSVVPPTINLDNLDPDCAALGLNFTPNEAVEKRIDYALSNGFGFGGTNASIVVGRV